MTSWSITEPQQLSLDGERVDRFDVRLNAGRLSIVGTDGPPRVEVGRASETPIAVDLVDGVLRVAHAEVRTWPGVLAPVWWWLNSRPKFEATVAIAVPYETPGLLWVGSGAVVVSSIHADVRAECVSGRITLLGVDGALRAKVVSGPIEALGCAGDVELETVSGEIVLADTAASRVRARTVSGSLIADLDNPPHDCEIRLDTISGEITIRVRADSHLDVVLSAAHGRVTSDFDGMSGHGTWGTSSKGVLGSGAGSRSGPGRLRATAVGGNISLLRRPFDADFGGTDAS